MSTDRAELAADDFAAVLGGINRYRQIKLHYLIEQYRLYKRTLGEDANPTQHAYAMLLNTHAKMQAEAI